MISPGGETAVAADRADGEIRGQASKSKANSGQASVGQTSSGQASVGQASGRLHGIEGLRGIAAMTVLVHHVLQYLSNAHTGLVGRLGSDLATGLTLFFVLSGFLLYRPFAAAIIAGAPLPSLRRYSGQRFRRIYPGYLAIFCLTAFVLGAAYQAGPPSLPEADHGVGYLAQPVTVLADLALLQTYIPGQLLTGIGPAWSLTTEIAFYALMPLAAVQATRLARRRLHPVGAALVPAAAFVATGLVASAWLEVWSKSVPAADLQSQLWGQNATSIAARSVLANAALFGMGMLAAVGQVLVSRGLAVPRAAVVAATTAALLGLAIDLTGHGGFFADTAAAFGLATLLLLTTTRWTRAGALLEARPLTYLGTISYSIYLWHVPVLWFLVEHHWAPVDRSARSAALDLLLIAGITLPLAALTYRFVEHPGMTFRRRPALQGSAARA